MPADIEGTVVIRVLGLVALPGTNELVVTYDMIARPCPRKMCLAHPDVPCGCDLIVSMKLLTTCSPQVAYGADSM